MQPDYECDFEKHYSIRELSRLWHLSYEATRRLFQDEVGVLRIGHGLRRNKRNYVSLRIPASIARKVYQRVTSGRSQAARKIVAMEKQ
jgi:hypothetical protein